ncbi:MAG: aldo/keto reductase [Defluviitaleaceae bacterium]|nr:aldo/keto reductase [Defluviitaleaceae bacterium]MCL2189782.1 aldo/keto reductase [Defluviitaleaceae bacterium]MCL2275414.1 aldo/keto reductase [Defluviitaleaceae bacterium]
MQYKEFGKTGVTLSALGFGAMRLPMMQEGEKKVVNEALAIPLIRRAIDLGVNYIDSAPYYCEKQSEIAVGKALKDGYRNKVYITTKNPIENDSASDWTGRLEHSLKQMDVDYIDFYHFWGINLKGFKHWETLTDGPLQAAQRALDAGLIKHLVFSYHDKPENLRYIVDSGRFEACLIQYNLLDRSNEENIAYMHEKGMGVVVMGPVAGGRLGAPSDVIAKLLPEKPASTAEMAMRFVHANPNVHVALSGMENIQMLEENVKIASKTGHLTPDELAQVKKMMEENKKLAELYCTSCDYCKPCPQEINIPHIFGMMNTHKVYGLTEHAKKAYAEMQAGTAWVKSADVTKCVECGICEEKCPQKLPVVKQLKETHDALAG